MARPGRLDRRDAAKISKGAAVGFGGLALTALLNTGLEIGSAWLNTHPLGPVGSSVATVGFGILVNTIRKLRSNEVQ